MLKCVPSLAGGNRRHFNNEHDRYLADPKYLCRDIRDVHKFVSESHLKTPPTSEDNSKVCEKQSTASWSAENTVYKPLQKNKSTKTAWKSHTLNEARTDKKFPVHSRTTHTPSDTGNIPRSGTVAGFDRPPNSIKQKHFNETGSLRAKSLIRRSLNGSKQPSGNFHLRRWNGFKLRALTDDIRQRNRLVSINRLKFRDESEKSSGSTLRYTKGINPTPGVAHAPRTGDSPAVSARTSHSEMASASGEHDAPVFLKDPQKEQPHAKSEGRPTVNGKFRQDDIADEQLGRPRTSVSVYRATKRYSRPESTCTKQRRGAGISQVNLMLRNFTLNGSNLEPHLQSPRRFRAMSAAASPRRPAVTTPRPTTSDATRSSNSRVD